MNQSNRLPVGLTGEKLLKIKQWLTATLPHCVGEVVMRNDSRRWLAHNDDLSRAVGEQRVEFDGKRMPADRAETRKLIYGHRRDVVKPRSVSIPLRMEVALAAKARVKVIADQSAACLWEVVKTRLGWSRACRQSVEFGVCADFISVPKAVEVAPARSGYERRRLINRGFPLLLDVDFPIDDFGKLRGAGTLSRQRDEWRPQRW